VGWPVLIENDIELRNKRDKTDFLFEFKDDKLSRY
jgi:hypothetical protein